MQIQISWLLQKPTDLDLHCLQRKGISKFSTQSSNKQTKRRIPSVVLHQDEICKVCFEQVQYWKLVFSLVNFVVERFFIDSVSLRLYFVTFIITLLYCTTDENNFYHSLSILTDDKLVIFFQFFFPENRI